MGWLTDAHQVNLRRACRTRGAEHGDLAVSPGRSGTDNAALFARLQAHAAERPLYGYRRRLLALPLFVPLDLGEQIGQRRLRGLLPILVTLLDRLCTVGHCDQEGIAQVLLRRLLDALDQVDHLRVAATVLLFDQVDRLDGEIVAVDSHGIPRFQMLQHRSTMARSSVTFYGFDLLHLNGRDLTKLALDKRRSLLRRVLVNSELLFSESLQGTPEQLVAAARDMRLEGVIAKRRDSLYEAGRRSGAWRKLRINLSQEFVLGGYSPGSPFDAILVGYFDRRQLLFCSRVRAGLSKATRRQVYERIQTWQVPDCPFTNLPSRKSGGWNEGVSAEDMATMTWVKPRLVVQIAFVEWTTYDLLRHASFVGIRDDKRASDVSRE